MAAVGAVGAEGAVEGPGVWISAVVWMIVMWGGLHCMARPRGNCPGGGRTSIDKLTSMEGGGTSIDTHLVTVLN